MVFCWCDRFVLRSTDFGVPISEWHENPSRLGRDKQSAQFGEDWLSKTWSCIVQLIFGMEMRRCCTIQCLLGKNVQTVPIDMYAKMHMQGSASMHWNQDRQKRNREESRREQRNMKSIKGGTEEETGLLAMKKIKKKNKQEGKTEERQRKKERTSSNEKISQKKTKDQLGREAVGSSSVSVCRTYLRSRSIRFLLSDCSSSVPFSTSIPWLPEERFPLLGLLCDLLSFSACLSARHSLLVSACVFFRSTAYLDFPTAGRGAPVAWSSRWCQRRRRLNNEGERHTQRQKNNEETKEEETIHSERQTDRQTDGRGRKCGDTTTTVKEEEERRRKMRKTMVRSRRREKKTRNKRRVSIQSSSNYQRMPFFDVSSKRVHSLKRWSLWN